MPPVPYGHGELHRLVEKVMLHIRVVTAGALLLLMAGAAAAQSNGAASTAAPEKPVSLLQLLLKPAATSEPTQDEQAAQAPAQQAQPEPTAHTRVAHRHKSARKYAHRKAHDDDATAESPASDSAATTAAPAPDTTASAQAAPDQSNVSAVVVDGHTVQIASPDQVNMMDMAAGDAQAASQQAVAVPQQAVIADPPQAADSQQAIAPPAEPAATEGQPAATDQTPESTQPVVAMASVAQRNDGSDKSRDLWYEKLLMTLSGAFVASSVAWLLIGSAPPRRSEPMLTYETERMTR
jgi:ribonuclease E